MWRLLYNKCFYMIIHFQVHNGQWSVHFLRGFANSYRSTLVLSPLHVIVFHSVAGTDDIHILNFLNILKLLIKISIHCAENQTNKISSAALLLL